MARLSLQGPVVAGMLAIALSVLTPTLSAAATPPAGAAVANRVMAASDPAAAYSKLSAAEKSAYIAAVSAVTIEAVPHGSPIPVATVQGFAAASTTCWTWEWEVDGKATFGVVVFRYFQDMGWCANGTTISSLTWHNRRGEVDFVGWNFSQVPADWTTSGGVGHSTWRSFTQATFSWCLPVCAQYRYPWLDMTAHANGTGTGSVGGAN